MANFALDGLENKIRSAFPLSNRKTKVHFVRYADDFIITGTSKELLEKEVAPIVELHFKERGLELSAEKTKITHIDEGFDFLGQNVRKYSGKLLIKPSKKSCKSCRDKIRKIISCYKAASQELLIAKLNPVIRGWTNYHSHVISKKIFSDMDHFLWKLLWKWAKRRHPNKNLQWIKNRYFVRINKRDWIFQDKYETAEI